MEACGICGTDIHIFDGTANSNPPVILGHEYVGVVSEVGSSVSRFQKGDRVVVDPNVNCGHCYYCRRGMVHFCENLTALGVDLDGGFAEYSIVQETQVFTMPDNIPLDWGAFVEPLSCVVHGVDLANIKTGDTVVILGAGAIGLMMIELISSSGAGLIIIAEPSKERREIASMFSADIIINPTDEDVRDITLKNTYDGADIVIECAGTPETSRLSFDLVRRGGKIIFFGVCDKNVDISIKPQEIYYNELSINGSFINPHTFSRAIEILSLEKIDLNKFNIMRFPLDELLKAFDHHKERKATKTMLIPKT